jgi:hypothetical protein
MPLVRDWVTWCLLAVAVACLAVGLFPRWADGVDPATGDRLHGWKLGLWASPSFEYVRRETQRGGFTIEWGINFISWSCLLVVVGWGCLEMSRWRRRSARSTTPPSLQPQPPPVSTS